MESGSLLKEALDAMQESRNGGGILQNRLDVDVFVLAATPGSNQGHFQALAEVCRALNKRFKTLMEAYPWFSGGEGPIFGIHVTDKIAHLRASCRYGANVEDEWSTVAAVLILSKENSGLTFRFWDADDGHILLIESAMNLPDWVDQIGPPSCAYRCWLLEGKVTLVPPTNSMAGSNQSIELKDAIDRLRENQILERPEPVQSSIERKLSTITIPPLDAWQTVTHRTAIVLPRRVYHVLEKYPSLIQCAIVAFERHSYVCPPAGRVKFDDLVFNTKKMGRTGFALLRTLTTSVWQSEDYIPPTYKSVEVKRVKRKCEVQSTPHLKHALALGVRISAGLDYILGESVETTESPSAQDRILQHWSTIDIACGGDGSWLRDAWVAGPNESKIDLTDLLSFPIASVDLCEMFPLPTLRPHQALKQMLQGALAKEVDDDKEYPIPRQSDVDGEEWMYLPPTDEPFAVATKFEEQKHETNAKAGIEQLDELLGDVKEFVEGEGDLEGVVTNTEVDLNKPVVLNPALFINLLHKVLVSTPDEIANLTLGESEDNYFSQEDYDDAEDLPGEPDLEDVMSAMDKELSLSSESRKVSQTETSSDGAVLSGLVDSLEASEAAAGPVRNIVREMHRDTS